MNSCWHQNDTRAVKHEWFRYEEFAGKDENDRREFKEAEALRRPANIGREVVGFLNAGGGDIWIGVEEKEGRAVGFQQIADIDRSLISLRDQPDRNRRAAVSDG